MRVAVVTGANRGIGLEIARQLAQNGVHVILTARSDDAARAASESLKGQGIQTEPYPLDVTQPDTVLALSAHVIAEHGGLDILVNNAGIAMDGFNGEVARKTLDVNFFGALRVTEKLLPQMRAGGRIVLLSSGLADRRGMSKSLAAKFTDPHLTVAGLSSLMGKFVTDVAAGNHSAQGWPSSAYSVSKTGLNALALVLSRMLANDPRRILVNAVCPGWVQTAMGGAGASRTVEHGAETPVWAALLPDGGPSGGFYRDMEPASW
ncbi:MAG: SDR family NAD(P)-dependent oxidoreductase [Polyangiaceae bacterium]|nr:SDR family NAD(P)-dependent oxidoreductase [Polyangiaceae bacterium]